ncbi:unnamed protein product [Pylaiella littoralis]
MKSSSARRALLLLLLQAHVAAFSGPSPGQRPPRAPRSTAASEVSTRACHPPSAFRRPRPGQAPRAPGGGRAGGRAGGGGGGGSVFRETTSPPFHTPLTALHGWFDGWGQGDGPSAADKKGREAGSSSAGGSGTGGGGSGAGRKNSSSSRSSGRSSSARGASEATPSQGGDIWSLFSRAGKSGSSDSGSGSGSDGKSEGKGTADERGQGGRGGGVVQTLAAVGESFSAGAAAFQERFSETNPENVTLILGGGKILNVTSVPWKGVGIYAGGLLSGLAIAVGLLTVPYAELGSPGLRKSLTLFENVLVDIDQGYVEEVNPERLLETAVGSMLRTLDPYTEYQNNQAAADLKETVSGRYGGVGLVISGGKQRGEPGSKGEAEPPNAAQQGGLEKKGAKEGGAPGKKTRPAGGGGGAGAGGGAERGAVRDGGITVVSAFEGYAFDAGMRAGDRITAINGKPVEGISVDKVRDQLRGEPNSQVSISFLRDGSNAQMEQEITLTRRLVKLRDVKLATLVGDVKNAPVGYLELSGFSKGAAQELQQAYRYLDSVADGGLRGVILDMRGNPGGLLEAAVDVSALFVPEGSRIVSIKGRNFQDITYGSSQGPVRPASTPLVVLINGGTASAAEIVSGAVQDLDAGVIVGVGDGRTYGKGLVQNVAELPYNNALKYTVAKYYTPSGRCIQSVNYKEGGVAMGEEKQSSGFGFEASEVPELERKEFITKHGRVVFDGGGVEADVKVKLPKPSALEIALQASAHSVQGAFFDFAGQWTKSHTFKGTTDVVTDGVLRDFEHFVNKRQAEGIYDLAAIYGPQLQSLESILKDSNLSHYDKLVEPLPKRLTQEMLRSFDARKEQIRIDLEEAILSRYLPESMVLRKQLDKDPQFQVALELVQDKGMYNRIITPADAKLTEDVLRSFGQALKDSVQRGELRLDLSSADGEGPPITITPSAQGLPPASAGFFFSSSSLIVVFVVRLFILFCSCLFWCRV